MNNQNIQIAVIDKYIVINLSKEKGLLPDWTSSDEFARVLSYYSYAYDIICDFRGVKSWTGDIKDFVTALAASNRKVTILIDPNEFDYFFTTRDHLKRFFKSEFSTNLKFHAVRNAMIPFPYFDINTSIENLEEVPEKQYWNDIYTREEIKFAEYIASESFLRHKRDYQRILLENAEQAAASGAAHDQLIFKRYFEHQISLNQKASPLIEFAFATRNKEITLLPYQSRSLHNLETKNGLLLAKPGVIAARTNAILKNQYEEFIFLINKTGVKELEITNFIENNPQFLRILGYKEVYPQIVLERESESKLIPDFILQPQDDDWCDILDFKKPKEKIIVGPSNRKQFASEVTALAAQLREYASYFENPKYAKRVQEVYGIKCYRPKMIGVIGKKLDTNDDREVRRLMTSYPDLEIVTFDKLQRAAKSRLLI